MAEVKGANLKNPNTIHVTVLSDIDVTLTSNDIFNWLSQCNDVDILNYLGTYALKRRDTIKNPDNDPMRSL